MITYNADSADLYGVLYHYPAGIHPNGTMRKVYDWDSGVYLGEIPEARVTYNVIGNMNEFQLAISETTFGGLESLQHQDGAIIDYGSLIYITLQRARNAREAIKIMGDLVAEYGYYSEGESFSITDPEEIWVLEMIGKGQGEKGAVWVAVKIPDGYICAHANQARIRTFPLNNPDECVYSPDVISFAKRKGFYPSNAPDSEFSFSDVYNPITFSGARFCDARVYSFFSKVDSAIKINYLDYAQGYNLTNRMPLYIKPSKKISVNDSMVYLRDHYEGTWLEFSSDIGAEAYNAPYRWRPLTWSYGKNEYLNERAISTPQTGFTFVAQTRNWLPDPIGGILWFGVDDSAMSVRVPIYCGITRAPEKWAIGHGDLMTFKWDSAFWVFNLVSNYAYSRYSIIYPDVLDRINMYQAKYFKEIASIDAGATAQFKKGDKDSALRIITEYSTGTANALVSEWLDFFQELFVKYMDGYTKFPNKQGGNPIITNPGYSESWRGQIVNQDGKKYLIPSTESPKGTQSRLLSKIL